jgi:hypothetical protein
VNEAGLLAEAVECDNCLCWLEHCEAECCRVFTFYLTLRSDVAFGKDEVRLHTVMTPDLKRYYELHGARVEGDWVVVPREACKTTLDRLEVYMTCRELRADNLCGLHKKGKPRACAELTLETAESGDYGITPRCLYGYKLEARSAG